MQRPVLIVIDMLTDYLEAWSPELRTPLIRSTNQLLATFRDAGLPIVWVRQEFEPDLSDAFPEMKARRIHICIKGTPGAAIWPDLQQAASDHTIVKKRYSAFFGTALDAVLAELNPDAIVLAGINTHACIRTTAIDAYQRDWPVVLASDCIGSYDHEHHAVSLKYMRDKIARVLSNAQIAAALSHQS